MFCLNELGGYHLPEYDDCPIQFMRDILTGTKKVWLIFLILIELGNQNGEYQAYYSSILR